ncbi:Nn.00g008060.m01.CDS01 [Neocucurbitaria sp. VM-36]
MENTTMEPYSDSPTDPRSVSPATSASSTTIKPLPALPTQSPRYAEVEGDEEEQEEEPYRDEPPTPTEAYPPHNPPQYRTHHPSYQPYTDYPTSPSEGAPPPTSDDDVPLAHLVLQPRTHHHFEASSYPHVTYPLEAPPSYYIAVRQSYRDTLIQHIPSNHQHDPRDPILVEIDEEVGMEMVRADDVRHSVERVVAMFVVASLLLIIAAVLGWLALGSGLFG